MFNIKYETLVSGVLTLLCATVPLSGQQVASANAPATFAPADTAAKTPATVRPGPTRANDCAGGTRTDRGVP